MDPEDDDPVRFWGAAAASFDRAAAMDGRSPFATVAQAARSPQPPSPIELAASVAQAVESSGTGFILVLDDFHRLSSLAVMESFARFAERPPEGLRLVLLSRGDPPLPLARLRARGLIGELRADELRFAPDEAERILRAAAGGRLTAEQARAIADKTEGWGAGLRLAAVSLEGRADPEAFVRGFSGSDRLVLEFLAEEVLAAQAEELRDFLLRSAVLDRFSAELLDGVLAPRAGSAELLRRVEASKLFLVPLDDEGRWFRYHHLFAETLRSRLRSAMPGEEAAILARAAAWLEGRGELEGALELHLRAGDRREAARLLERVDYLARGELTTVTDLLAKVGDQAISERARLVDLVAWTKAFMGKGTEAEAYMRRASEELGALDEAGKAYVRGSFAALRAFLLALRGRLPEAQTEARAAAELLAPDDYYPWSIVSYVFGSALRSQGRFAEALAEFGRLEEIARALGSAWTIYSSQYEKATTAFLMGRLSEARSILDLALADAEEAGAGGFPSVAKLRAVRAEILYERGEAERAEAELAPVMESVRGSGMAGTKLEVAAAYARSLLARGALDEAEEVLESSRALVDRSVVLPALALSIRGLRLRLSVLRRAASPGLPVAAEDGASGELPATADYGDAVAAEAAERLAIETLLARGLRDEAAVRAAALAQAAEKDGRGRALVAARAYQAVALAGGNGGEARRDDARAALAAAVEAARGERFLRTFVDLGEDMRRLLVEYAASGTGEAPAYAAVLTAAFGPTEEGGAAKAKAALISARELEALALLAEGLSNKDIAARLFVSESTVKSHLYHLAAKLEAPNRVAIVARARALGLFE